MVACVCNLALWRPRSGIPEGHSNHLQRVCASRSDVRASRSGSSGRFGGGRPLCCVAHMSNGRRPWLPTSCHVVREWQPMMVRLTQEDRSSFYPSRHIILYLLKFDSNLNLTANRLITYKLGIDEFPPVDVQLKQTACTQGREPVKILPSSHSMVY